MEKTMSLAKMHEACFLAVFNLFNQYNFNDQSNIAVVKSECSYPAVVGALRKKAALLPSKTRQSKFSTIDSVGNPVKVKIFSERVWELKINNRLIFDMEKYSLRDLMSIALNIPMAKIYSDYAIEYYSDGSRKLCKAARICYVNKFRRPPLASWRRITARQARQLFPQELEQMNLSRWLISAHDNRRIFLTDPEAKSLILVMNEDYDYYLPFNCILNNSEVENCNKVSDFELDGNLLPLFSSLAQVLKKGLYDVLANNRDLCSFEQVRYERKTEDKDDDILVPKQTNIRLAVGCADIPYEEALRIVCATDLDKLRRQYAEGTKFFSLTESGELLNARNVTSSVFYKDGSTEKIVLLPQETFLKWGEKLPSEFMDKLAEPRNFAYHYWTGFNACMFADNIAGKPEDNTAQNSIELQRLLALPAAGFEIVDGIDVKQLGDDVVHGRMTLEEIGKRFTKVAMLIEEVTWKTSYVEGAHFSSPDRHCQLTGAYSGHVYEHTVEYGKD